MLYLLWEQTDCLEVKVQFFWSGGIGVKVEVQIDKCVFRVGLVFMDKWSLNGLELSGYCYSAGFCT